MTVNVLITAGSARRESLNKKLARVASQVVPALGAAATFVDLSDFPLPIYHADLEAAEGVPPPARELASLMRAHQALVIASPENNASVSALLKNAIDWASRVRELDPFAGKVAALMAASPGGFGGMRGLVHLRQILQTLGVLVVPQQFVLARAHEAFDAEGGLADPAQTEQVHKLLARLVEVTDRLNR